MWVDPEHVFRILRDDGYKRLDNEADVQRGDVVIYHDQNGEPCHVGVVIDKNIVFPGGQEDALKVLSKWGGDGEYIHPASKVPAYLGRPGEYWTDRRSA